MCSNRSPIFLMAGVPENAYQLLTIELAKSVSRPTPELDQDDLWTIMHAGEFFLGMFNSDMEPFNLFNILWGPGLVFGLFKDEADWVSSF